MSTRLLVYDEYFAWVAHSHPYPIQTLHGILKFHFIEFMTLSFGFFNTIDLINLHRTFLFSLKCKSMPETMRRIRRRSETYWCQMRNCVLHAGCIFSFIPIYKFHTLQKSKNNIESENKSQFHLFFARISLFPPSTYAK